MTPEAKEQLEQLKNLLYWNWIESEAALIESDGCTRVSGLFRECCWEHDLAFRYGKDPRSAYLIWIRSGDRVRAWTEADPISFDKANSDFKNCHIQRTKLGILSFLNPFSWWRWRGVQRLSRGIWDRHREREMETYEKLVFGEVKDA